MLFRSISSDEIKTNNNIGEINLFRPLNEDEKNLVQRGINKVYSDFLKIVSDARLIEINEVDKLARGKVYYGDESKKLNLIDVIGELNDAIKIASEMAGIDEFQIIEYPKHKTEFERIISSLQQSNQLIEPLLKNNWVFESILKNTCPPLATLGEFETIPVNFPEAYGFIVSKVSSFFK